MAMGIEMPRSSVLGDGVLNINKAAGWTSHDVVAKLRNTLSARRIGHAGTLDPAATGVLPVLVGRATRIAEYLLDWDKEYHAVLRLGITTDTQDATGAVLTERSIAGVTESDIRHALSRFRGPLRQLPPMYSAVKVKGVPLYKAARAGKTLDRGPRDVTVYEIEVSRIEGSNVWLRVVCSKGTYVRTLCADIGDNLGVGGHLCSLERTRVGPLTVQDALTVEQAASRFALGDLRASLVSLDKALAAMPAGIVDAPTSSRVLHGVPVPLSAVRWEGDVQPIVGPSPQTVRLKTQEGRLLALGSLAPVPAEGRDGDGTAQPVVPILKVLADHPAEGEA